MDVMLNIVLGVVNLLLYDECKQWYNLVIGVWCITMGAVALMMKG